MNEGWAASGRQSFVLPSRALKEFVPGRYQVDTETRAYHCGARTKVEELNAHESFRRDRGSRDDPLHHPTQ